MFFVVFVLSLISGLILPCEDAASLHSSLHERPNVLTFWQDHLSLALEHVLFEVTFVSGAVWKFVKPFSVFGAVQEVSSVLCSVFPFLLSSAIGQIVQPFSRIRVIFGLVDQCAFSLCYIVPDLTFVVTSLAEDVPSISMRESMSEGAVVIRAVFEE